MASAVDSAFNHYFSNHDHVVWRCCLSQYIIPVPLDSISIIGVIHGVAGSIAFALGVMLVAAWHFSRDVKGCFKRKNIMRVTITLWVLALVLGIASLRHFLWPSNIGLKLNYLRRYCFFCYF